MHEEADLRLRTDGDTHKSERSVMTVGGKAECIRPIYPDCPNKESARGDDDIPCLND